MNQASAARADTPDWWRGGIIYQIYPRSFQDSNGDGVGDLPGITQRLAHVAALGADAVWLSPVFKSPMKDFGYDVSDYRDIDPLFGTLDDFRELVRHAHSLGLKVMIDQVLSHTSDQHPWFIESRASQDNSRADWYVWADARDDGTPPNNWLSIFGGSAWQWDTRRLQYYLHNFLASQPDLNFHNPQVRAAILDDVRFWLELGVDGYRLDTANFYFHDQALRNNPGRGQPEPNDASVDPVNPYSRQHHVYDKSRPENLGFLKELRALLDRYPGSTMVGEIGDDDSLARIAEYTQGGDKLHMAYSFDLFAPKHSATFLHGLLKKFMATVGDGWPCWALSNHDVVRVATRWGGAEPDARLLRLAAAFQMSLRGSPCIYQGDELGLTEADIPFEQLQDPYGKTMWPEFKGRDGCRTPMPWEAQEMQGAFSSAAPWLPLPPQHLALAVDAQRGDPHSLLSFYTGLIHWRAQHPVLVQGDMQLLPLHPQVLAFERSHAGQCVLCVFNFSDVAVDWPLPPAHYGTQALEGSGLQGALLIEGYVALQPWGGYFGLAR
jgi:alpha-glucosidase